MVIRIDAHCKYPADYFSRLVRYLYELKAGGPIAYLEDGDIIDIDIPNRKLNVLISDEEMDKRKANWVKPEPKIKTGYLSRYAKLTTSASTGAVLE